MKLIIACDPNGGIGYKGELPWTNIQGDLPRFKNLTQGQVIIMGRNTWESLPKKPLPNRFNVVVTSKPIDNATIINDISLQFYSEYTNAWIIGGAKLINTNWWCINEVHLSKTFTKYTCDTFFDLLYLEKMFTLVSTETFSDHVYQIWKRK